MSAREDPKTEHDSVRVLGIAGSLRAESYNRRLLQLAVERAPHGARVRVWGGLKAIPPFDEDDEAAPAGAVLELRETIAASDALLLVTPEYNGSLPGQLKTMLDWASRPRAGAVLRDKIVAVIGASPSPSGARTAQADVRRVLTRAGALVIDSELVVPSVHARLGAAGRPGDEDMALAVRDVVIALTNAARPAARHAA
jgi:chromate reductase